MLNACARYDIAVKRRAVLILLLLVGGAIVNVAVAWGCYYWIDPTQGNLKSESMYHWPAPERWQETTVLRSVGRDRIRVDLWTYYGPWRFNEDPNAKAPTYELVLCTDRSGFPAIAVERRFSGSAPVGRMPLRALWPGFAINTVFYAVVLWMLFAAPFALRRRRRIKRGLCPKCAYPVGTNAVCTECGAAVTPRMPNIAEGVP